MNEGEVSSLSQPSDKLPFKDTADDNNIHPLDRMFPRHNLLAHQVLRADGTLIPLYHSLSVNVYQFRRQTTGTRALGLPAFSSMSERKPQMGLVLSKQSLGPSPPCVQITKFAYDPCSGFSSDERIDRKPSSSGKRFEVSSHV